MSNVRCKIDDLDKVLNDILEDYGDNVVEATQEAVRKVAKIAQEEVKAKSTVRKYGKKKGRYKKGWTTKEEIVNRMRADVIIHNRTDYQLTHLLENGHVVRNKKGTYGRAPAIKHIAPAAEKAEQALVERLENKL